MSCDKLVYDLSQEVEGSPNVFIRKDWLNILDNQNQNYQSNQSIIDTSQLSNSNKYLGYREAYLMIPMILTFANSTANKNTTYQDGTLDKVVGLKNWFGTIIHSFTLDYNGTTIIQQTPFCNIWNSFKLMTTLSWNDVMTQGSTIGFYPDDPSTFKYYNTKSNFGNGTCNNNIVSYANLLTFGPQQNFDMQNEGLIKRINNIIFDTDISIGSKTYGQLLNNTDCGQLWKSYISQKVNGSATVKGYQQISITAIVYLKHIHSFFNMVPLLKGAFMKMTLNLNSASCSVLVSDVSGTGTKNVGNMKLTQSTVPIGGVNPIMMNSLTFINSDSSGNIVANLDIDTYIMDLSVGSRPLSSLLQSNNNDAYKNEGKVSKSIYLYVPAYTFNPPFEKAYLANPIKQIKYTDIYQYQVTNIGGGASGANFNNLITNGIANIKSVLVIPLFNSNTTVGNNGELGDYASTGLSVGTASYASPFDPVGTGTTAPLVHFTNFNVQISGQNAIYNMQRYTFEQFNNQLYGQNAVNGGLTDGLTSGLIDYLGFQMSQCFYYVNVERMLPVEQSVPKSVQIIGTNKSQLAIDLMVFVEYGVEIQIDLLTGARV